MLTVHGSNLGTKLKYLEDKITVGGTPCVVQEEGFEASTRYTLTIWKLFSILFFVIIVFRIFVLLLLFRSSFCLFFSFSCLSL